ncbi:hypothetical protein Tco_0990460 [Tanacetum coccineum]|uniref:Uncharacterized protein n=1 Tax=Tanacetum coccineum TaxID=301880 RepID=A0ABQ5EWH7_9ASTR
MHTQGNNKPNHSPNPTLAIASRRSSDREIDSKGELNLEAKGGYVIWLGHVGGLEDDEEGLVDVLVKLETSYGELDGPCGVSIQGELVDIVKSRVEYSGSRLGMKRTLEASLNLLLLLGNG